MDNMQAELAAVKQILATEHKDINNPLQSMFDECINFISMCDIDI